MFSLKADLLNSILMNSILKKNREKIKYERGFEVHEDMLD